MVEAAILLMQMIGSTDDTFGVRIAQVLVLKGREGRKEESSNFQVFL